MIILVMIDDNNTDGNVDAHGNNCVNKSVINKSASRFLDEISTAQPLRLYRRKSCLIVSIHGLDLNNDQTRFSPIKPQWPSSWDL